MTNHANNTFTSLINPAPTSVQQNGLVPTNLSAKISEYSQWRDTLIATIDEYANWLNNEEDVYKRQVLASSHL